MGYEEEFRSEVKDLFKSYKRDLESVLEGDVDALYAEENNAEIAAIREAYNNGSLKIEGDIDEYIAEHMEAYKEEQEQSIFNHLNDYGLEVQELKSGYAANQFFGVEIFNDDKAYAVMPVTIGGPNVYYIVGNLGDVYLSLNWGNESHFEKIGSGYENSELYEFLEMATGYKLGENEFYMDDDEVDARWKKDLGYDSVADYLDQNLTFVNEFLIERELLIEYLDKNNLNINNAAEAILTEGAYNCWYYSDDGDGDMVDTTRAQFVANFEHFADRLEELKNNSDFEDFASLFGIDEDGMEFDADMIEVELDEKFGPVEPDEPTQKVNKKPKP